MTKKLTTDPETRESEYRERESFTCTLCCMFPLLLLLGAEDKTLIIWETKRGLALTSLALHVPLLGFQLTNDCSRIAIHLLDRGTNYRPHSKLFLSVPTSK